VIDLLFVDVEVFGNLFCCEHFFGHGNGAPE
jgi:hypothetical protein